MAKTTLIAMAVATVLLFVGGLALASALGPRSSAGASSTTDTTSTGTTVLPTTSSTTTGSTTTTDTTTTCSATTEPTTTGSTTTTDTTTGATTTTDTTTGSTTTTDTTTGATTTTDTTTGSTTTTDTTSSMCPAAGAAQDQGPGAKYSVVNGTVNAATDHERLGSSAFPNFQNGAVDNYYAMAHSHVDNSPFAEGTASPGDTGPIGQTAAAGNAQQPQYADARWPGDTGKATFGSQGGPYAEANASDYNATADASEASNGLGAPSSGTSNANTIAVPKGFDLRLRRALKAWRAKWAHRLGLKLPPVKVTTPAAPTVTTPATPKVTTPTLPAVTVPSVTVPGLATTPSATVPTVTVPSVTVPQTSVPKTTVPSVTAPQAASSPRSMASWSGGTPSVGTPSVAKPSIAKPSVHTPSGGTSSSGSSSGDGAALLESSTQAGLDPQTGDLVTSGESSLGRVSLGGGQILVEGIHVSASITNSGSAQPDTSSTDMSSTDTNSTGTSTTDTTQTGTGTTGTTQTGTGTTGTGQTTTSGGIPTGTSSTDTSSTGTATTDTTSTDSGAAPAYKVSIRIAAASIGGVPVTIDQDGVHVAGQNQALPYQQASDALNGVLKQAGIQLFVVGPQIATSNGEETIDATGLHVVFTQPVSAPGAPSQFAEHILGEVFVDSLAVLGGPPPSFDLSGGGFGGPLAGATKKSGVASKHHGRPSAKGLKAPAASGPASSMSMAAQPSASSYTGGASQPASSFSGSGGSQPVSSSTGSAPQPAAAVLTSALSKPKWMLLAYLVWQVLVIVTGVTLWRSRRGGLV